MDVALITGAGGQDGRLLSRLLVAQGLGVVGLVRRAQSAVEPGVEKRVCDVGARAALTDALETVKPARIFHLAAAHHSSDGAAGDEAALSREMERVNFDAAAAIVDWMADSAGAVRAVFAGSSQMYAAPADADIRIDETTPMAPRTFYGVTKARTRELVREARERRGLHAGFAILFNHESELRGPGFVTRKIVDAAAAHAPLELANIGARADWSAASDIVAALSRMAASERPGEFVLGSGEAHAVRDWTTIAFAHAGADMSAIRARSDQRTSALVADSSRAERELGWRRQTGFRSLVEAMTDAAIREFRSRGTER